MQTHFRNYEELATTPSRKLALLVAELVVANRLSEKERFT